MVGAARSLSGGARGAFVLRLVVLALVLFTPLAAAAETLASLEEPHEGTDKVWDVTILHEEADTPRALIFRNAPGSGFGLTIYDTTGAEVFVRNGSRGIQTLPALPAGEYRFFVRGHGEFQVTDKAWEKLLQGNVSTQLRGTDAYIMSPTRPYEMAFEGPVQVEWWDMTGAPEPLTPPATRSVKLGGAYVITVRGDEGASYAITLTEAEPEVVETPAPAAAAALIALAALAAFRRRK